MHICPRMCGLRWIGLQDLSLPREPDCLNRGMPSSCRLTLRISPPVYHCRLALRNTISLLWTQESDGRLASCMRRTARAGTLHFDTYGYMLPVVEKNRAGTPEARRRKT